MTFTVRDIEERYGVTERTVLHWIHTGQIKAINVGVEPGKKKPRWRFTAAAVDAFEAARASAPAVPPICRRKRQPSEVIEFIK